MKILITDVATLSHNGDVSLDIFEKFGSVVKYDNISRTELLKEVHDTDVLLCNKTVIDSEVFSRASKLRFIGTFATGYNNIDIPTSKSYGVTVSNAPEYSTNAVAQQVMAYILMHYTKAYEYNRFVKENGWKNSALFSPLVFATDEVCGKTLGIIGFGSIGRAVKKAAEGLGINVQVFTRTVRDNDEARFVSLDELLKTSDIVTMHCPLNEQSADMMNKETFSKMKRGAFFINTARGGVVDEEALKEALESGILSGAAVDVLKQEPMSKDCVLADAPNLIITPHSAWAPYTTRKRLIKLVAENLSAFLNSKPQNVVNN